MRSHFLVNIVTGIIMNSTQLLCTFTNTEELDGTISHIMDTYDVVFGVIYVLENTDLPGSFCCTYNVDPDVPLYGTVPDATISLHRKKSTNTLYTINALNLVVSELNGGKVDPRFQVPWENYRNTILVTAYNKLKRINTKLIKLVRVPDEA